MQLSEFSLDCLKNYAIGDGVPTRYMSGPELVKFFNSFGCRDVYGQGFPSRKDFAFHKLCELNGTPQLRQVIETLADSRRCDDPEAVATAINEIIKHDGFKLEKTSTDIYKLSGYDEVDPVEIEAHFADIKAQIVESIRSAKFSIWVAMAWFTDKDLGNELWKKHKEGLNVQVIVNDDEITQRNGLKFDHKDIGIEYYSVAPDSPWGKKIMHNKFCVIDLKKVIHGSYNWTNNAKYNNENITITDSRELAEDFAGQFIELKKMAMERLKGI